MELCPPPPSELCVEPLSSSSSICSSLLSNPPTNLRRSFRLRFRCTLRSFAPLLCRVDHAEVVLRAGFSDVFLASSSSAKSSASIDFDRRVFRARGAMKKAIAAITPSYRHALFSKCAARQAPLNNDEQKYLQQVQTEHVVPAAAIACATVLRCGYHWLDATMLLSSLNFPMVYQKEPCHVAAGRAAPTVQYMMACKMGIK